MDIRSTDRRIREKAQARALSALLVGFVLACQAPLSAQTAVHPVGGPRGASFEVEVVEANLKGAFDAVFCCDDLKATVRVEEVEDSPARVFLNVEVDPQAKLGVHVLQLLSDEGLSKRLTLQVNAEPHIAEQDGPHLTPSQAQLIEYPAVVNGRLSEDGEVDFYAIEVAAGRKAIRRLKSSNTTIGCRT